MHTIDENKYFVRLASINYSDEKSPPAFELVFRSVHLVKAKLHYKYKVHRHPGFEIIIPTKKTYKCYLNGVYLEVSPGQFLVVQTNDIHQDLFEPGLEFCCIIFDLKDSDLLKNEKMLFKDTIRQNSRICNFPDDTIARSVFEFISSEDVDDEPFAYYVLNGLFNVFFWKMLAAFPKGKLTPIFVKSVKDEAFKNILLDYFEKNIKIKINVQKIALAMKMSESSLAHKAKQILGVPPAKAFMNYKMKRAVYFLAELNMSVKETSAALGFEDQFHFSKNFKKYFKKPPSSFK